MNRLVRVVVAIVLGSIVLSGCDFDVYKLPLPGGTSTGEDPLTVTVEFDNVLDLVPQSSVKVNDVSVGKVTDVDLDGYTAVVTVQIRNDVDLPANTEATIRQTSLLGEKFVSLAAPADGAQGTLENGAMIPLDRTGDTPEVEEVLGALSLVLNGGGLDKVKTITTELNAALEGREDSVRSLLDQVSSFVGQLDQNKQDIVDAIESLNRLAIQLRRQQPKIDLALEELPSALLSLDRQRDDLVKMLGALDRLSDVGVRVIRKSKDNTIVTLRQLQPTLTQLANSGDDLVNSFNALLTYPFVDEVVGRDPQVARNLHMGDYVNLSVQLDLDLANLQLPGVPCEPLSAIPATGPLPDFEKLCQGAQDALAECAQNFDRTCLDGLLETICDQAPTRPICNLLGGVLPVRGGNGGGGGGLPGLPDLPGLPGLGGLDGLTSGLGNGLLNRPGTAPRGTGPTMGELMATYDPALVSLLTPGMVLR
ncbi:MCE family protein [Nocardioides litoris]|uniref:MCE family protein n=1 Tax=Nocardioides litoris TaxID=1926648 RepID=UPI001476B2EF|nr:MCE family protein [Nocardioides litoris]